MEPPGLYLNKKLLEEKKKEFLLELLLSG